MTRGEVGSGWGAPSGRLLADRLLVDLDQPAITLGVGLQFSCAVTFDNSADSNSGPMGSSRLFCWGVATCSMGIAMTAHIVGLLSGSLTASPLTTSYSYGNFGRE